MEGTGRRVAGEGGRGSLRVSLAAATALLLGVSTRSGTAQEGRAPRELPALVKVLDHEGRAVAGARVLFVSSRLPEALPRISVERREVQSDARGRVRVRLPAGRSWYVFAVHDEGRLRFASRQVPIAPGRPRKLILEPFPVPYLSVVGLEKWRKIFGKRLRFAWVTSESPSSIFTVELPEEKVPVLRHPPLPFGNFFPALIDDRGGLLDFVYFSPAFHEGDPQVEPLYDRDYPLKKVILAEPVRVEGRVQGTEGAKAAGARLFWRPEYSVMRLGREIPLRADGSFTAWLPYRDGGERAHYTSRLLAIAPDRIVRHRTLAELLAKRDGKRKGGIEAVLELPPGRGMEWSVQGDGGNGPPEGILWWRLWSSNPKEPKRKVFLWVDLPLEGPGRIPIPDCLGPHEGILGFLMQGGETIPISMGTRKLLPQKWTFDLKSLREVEIEVSGNGRPVPGGKIRVFPKLIGMPPPVIEPSLDRKGRCGIRLFPGTYGMIAWNDRYGVKGGEFQVGLGDGPLRWKVELEPFLSLHGRLIDEDGNGVKGRVVYANPAEGKNVPWYVEIRGLNLPPLVSRPTEADGSFEIQVPSWSRYYSLWEMEDRANAIWDAVKQEPAILVLRN